MKRVLLVNPAGTEQSGFSNPPLGLLYLAGALLEAGAEVRLVDCCIAGDSALERAAAEFRPDVAGITCLTPGRKRAVDAAARLKQARPGVLTVLGGAHPTIMWEQLLTHYPCVDIAVLGEGERAIVEIAGGREPASVAGIAFRSGGRAVKTAQRAYESDLDAIPFPAWSLLDLKRYPARGAGVFNGVDLASEPRVSVIFSRGCSGSCDFCSTWWIWRGWRCRSARNMAEELELLYKEKGVRHFCFADDALTVDRERVLQLCREIRSRGLRIAFSGTTRTDLVDAELLGAMKDAGCYNLAFGIESASPSLLAAMGKRNTVEASEKAVALCRAAGIKVMALMIAGSVGETWATIDESAAFLRRARPDEVGSVGGLWVLPGTKLYRDCAARGLINDDFWLGDEPYMLYTAEHTAMELTSMRLRLVNYDTLPGRLLRRIRRAFGWSV